MSLLAYGSVAHIVNYRFLFIFYPQYLTQSGWITNVERGRMGGMEEKRKGKRKKEMEGRRFYPREEKKNK